MCRGQDTCEPCGWRRCVCFTSLYPDTSSHLRTQADVTDHLWQVQVNYVSCVMRSSVCGAKVPRAGFNTDIAGTGHREVQHLTASTSPIFQGPSYNLSSLTQQLLFVPTFLWNNEYKTRSGWRALCSARIQQLRMLYSLCSYFNLPLVMCTSLKMKRNHTW